MVSQDAAADTAAAMRRFRDRYGRLLEWLVGGLMVILALEVTIGVVFRASGHALIWYDEIAAHLLAWLTFYGSALASVKRAHIACPEVVEQMPWGARRAINILAQVLVIAFFALMAYVGWTIMPILHTDALVSLPDVPMSVVQSVMPISAVLIIIAEVTHLVDLVVERTPPTKAIAAGGIAAADGLH